MPDPAVRRARVAVSAVFAIHGAVVGGFATRIPWIAGRLHLSAGALGLALITPALGAMLTMPLAGRLTRRYRGRPLARLLLTAWCLSVALPPLAPNLPLLCGALFAYGVTSGMADVAMNAQGVVVQERYGRSIMSGLHGLWSAGGLAASVVGAAAAHAGLDARAHLGAMAVLLAAAGLLACRGLLDEPVAGDDGPAFARPGRAILFIGLVGFCAVFAEGASADWCAMYLRTVTGAEAGVAAAAYTGFALTMTAARLAGDRVVRRLGPVPAVRLGGAVATAGGALVVAARAPAAGIAGFALIGLGVAVVVPLAFAAAGRTGSHPGRGIAGVATIAYGAGLAAPGAIGGIAQRSSLSASFVLVTALCAVVAVAAGALRAAAPDPRAAAREPAIR